jgi:hypothetical protein
VSEAELERQLASMIVPGELEARRRSWNVVRTAFAQHERLPQRRFRRNWPAVALAGAVVLVAAAVTPTGRSVFSDLRDAIGTEEETVVQTQPSLFSLPAQGRLLVESARGPWIVHPDGAKRLLGTYDEAGWSPFGHFVVASKADGVVALQPNGRVRWSLARRDVRYPRWGGTLIDTRIAYLSGRALHVVAGDGMGDRVLVRRVAQVAPAWKEPGSKHLLVFARPDNRVRIIDTLSPHVTAGWNDYAGPPKQLAASTDGSLVATRYARLLTVHNDAGLSRARISAGAPAEFLDVAFVPGATTLAYVTYDKATGRSTVVVVGGAGTGRSRQLFEGAGRITDIEWSPDGEWLLLAWETADQWVFIRQGDGASKIVSRSSITAQLSGGATDAPFPAIAGWAE